MLDSLTIIFFILKIKFISSMIESPLRRYKRNYPIDFSSSNQN